MCTCASCKVTDSFAAKSFADWPRGDPAGKRASESLYASHVAFGRKWGGARKPECAQRLGAGGSRREDPHARYFFPGAWRDNKLIPAEETTAGYVAAFLRLNGLLPEKQTPAAKPAPARPAAVGKPQQHFAAPMEEERDATAVIYRIPSMEPKLMSCTQAAAKFGVTARQVALWCEEGRIPASRIGRAWLIDAKAERPEQLKRGRKPTAQRQA